MSTSGLAVTPALQMSVLAGTVVPSVRVTERSVADSTVTPSRTSIPRRCRVAIAASPSSGPSSGSTAGARSINSQRTSRGWTRFQREATVRSHRCSWATVSVPA